MFKPGPATIAFFAQMEAEQRMNARMAHRQRMARGTLQGWETAVTRDMSPEKIRALVFVSRMED